MHRPQMLWMFPKSPLLADPSRRPSLIFSCPVVALCLPGLTNSPCDPQLLALLAQLTPPSPLLPLLPETTPLLLLLQLLQLLILLVPLLHPPPLDLLLLQRLLLYLFRPPPQHWERGMPVLDVQGAPLLIAPSWNRITAFLSATDATPLPSDPFWNDSGVPAFASLKPVL